VLDMHKEGLSYPLIGRNVGLSKNTVMDIVRRDAADQGCVEAAEPRHRPVLQTTQWAGLRGIWDTIKTRSGEGGRGGEDRAGGRFTARRG
jgi:hypothetical protein